MQNRTPSGSVRAFPHTTLTQMPRRENKGIPNVLFRSQGLFHESWDRRRERREMQLLLVQFVSTKRHHKMFLSRERTYS